MSMPPLPHARPVAGAGGIPTDQRREQPGLHGDPRAFGPAESGLIERYQLLVTFDVTEPGVHVNAPRTRCACPSLLLSAANGGGVDLLRLDVLLRFPMISISAARRTLPPVFPTARQSPADRQQAPYEAGDKYGSLCAPWAPQRRLRRRIDGCAGAQQTSDFSLSYGVIMSPYGYCLQMRPLPSIDSVGKKNDRWKFRQGDRTFCVKWLT